MYCSDTAYSWVIPPISLPFPRQWGENSVFLQHLLSLANCYCPYTHSKADPKWLACFLKLDQCYQCSISFFFFFQDKSGFVTKVRIISQVPPSSMWEACTAISGERGGGNLTTLPSPIGMKLGFPWPRNKTHGEKTFSFLPRITPSPPKTGACYFAS